MSMEQLMALVPLEAAMSHKEKGRRSRWEKSKKSADGSRWGSETDKNFLPPPFVDLPIGMNPLQVDRFLREQRLDELQRKLNAGILEFFDADIRPPSPPPIYDRNGGRVNTRDVRVRTAMQNELQRLCEFMVNNVEGFTPPPDFRPSKKIRRIEFPHEKYPDYNFMGIVIGPRGCNHKRLEAESGCTISVRGRGTQKEGKRDHQTDEEASMPMHVHIMGDTDEAVERAVALVEPLLDPLHPAHEEFKRRGLEQLALVNGVNYSDLDQRRCAICQALGHLAHECPDNQDLQPFKKAEVRCAICGDLGHVTMDCKMRRSDTVGAAGGVRPPPPPPMGGRQPPVYRGGTDHYKMDMEYRKMMDELSGDKSGLGALDAPRLPPGPGGPPHSPMGSSPGSQDYTPPPGVSPAGPGAGGASPYSGHPPPPPIVLGAPNRMGGGIPPPHIMSVHRAGPRGSWGGPGVPQPMGGDMHWGGSSMRPPMGMMPMGGMPAGMPWPMQPMMQFPPTQHQHYGDGMAIMGMWGGPMGPPLGYAPPHGGGQWQPMPPSTGCPMPGGPGTPQNAVGGPTPPAIPPPSAPSMPPPPIPGGSANAPADPDSMEFGD